MRITAPDAPIGATVDVLDTKIIGLLIEDGRMSNSEIARRVNVTETTVRNRIKRLTDSRAIKVSCLFQPSKVGLHANAMIRLQADPQHLMSISHSLLCEPQVRYVGITTGSYHIVVEGAFRTNADLITFLSDRIASLPGVRDVHPDAILRVEKMSYMDFSTGDSSYHPFAECSCEEAKP